MTLKKIVKRQQINLIHKMRQTPEALPRFACDLKTVWACLRYPQNLGFSLHFGFQVKVLSFYLPAKI